MEIFFTPHTLVSMKFNFSPKLISLVLLPFLILGPSVPVSAVGTPQWPTESPSSQTTLFDPSTSVTNTSPTVFAVSNAGGTAVDSINVQFNKFSTGENVDNRLTINDNDGSFSLTSGNITLDITWDSPATIQTWESYVPISGIHVFKFDFSAPYSGAFSVSVPAGSLISSATSDPKAIYISGYSSGALVNYTFSQRWPSLGSGPGLQSSETTTPVPAKYSGPEFSGLSGMGIMTGSTGKLEGKRLNEISAIEIGGKAATFTATSATELSLAVPAGLAPGLYDLVINSSAGKLTHINAIQVREPRKSFSITTRSTGKISESQYQEHALISSMQIPELNKARCTVNASSEAMAEAMANRLCALVKASNSNIETTIVVSRSTVKNDTVYARVTYGWN